METATGRKRKTNVTWQSYGALAGAGGSTLYTFQFTLHTLPLTLYTPHCTLYTPNPTLYTPHSSLDFALLNLQIFTPLYTLHFTSALYTLHSTLHIPQSTLHTLHTKFPTQHCNAPLSLHSTLRTQPCSTRHSLHGYGNRGRMYKTVEITCFTKKMFYVTAFGFVGCPCFFK